MEFPQPSSPLRHGHLFRKAYLNRIFHIFDSFLHVCMRTTKKPPLPEKPKKILISNLGFIGDVLLSSDAIASLKRRFPEAKFGFLVSSHAKPLFHGEIVHEFDSLSYLRRSKGLCKAALHTSFSSRKVVKEIKAQNYEMAIELYPYFANGVPIIAEANIPVRVGYSSGGFGALLTHPFIWKEYDKYWGTLHLSHLGLKAPEKTYFQFVKPSVTIPSEYVVVHMCSSKKEKDWKREQWIELIRRIPFPVVLVGKGKKDVIECEAVAKETECINLCDQLEILEYGAILQKAKLLITVDSMSVHLGRMVQVPMIVLYVENNFPHLWFPSYPQAKAIFLDPKVEEIESLLGQLCTS